MLLENLNDSFAGAAPGAKQRSLVVVERHLVGSVESTRPMREFLVPGLEDISNAVRCITSLLLKCARG